MKETETQAADAGDDVKLNVVNSIVKPLHKVISDNKDIAKLVMQLNAAVVMHRGDVNELLNVFSVYDQLWTTVKIHRFSVLGLQGVSEKKVAPPKTFGNIFTSVKSFCVKFCKFVGNSYPYISTNFCRFILIFH